MVHSFEKLIDVHIHASLALSLSKLRFFHEFQFSLQGFDLGALLLKKGLHDIEAGLDALVAGRQRLHVLHRGHHRLSLVHRLLRHLLLGRVVPELIESRRFRVVVSHFANFQIISL